MSEELLVSRFLVSLAEDFDINVVERTSGHVSLVLRANEQQRQAAMNRVIAARADLATAEQEVQRDADSAAPLDI